MKARKATGRPQVLRTPLENIGEWRKGCSCAPEGRPEECPACTRALIGAIEQWHVAQELLASAGARVAPNRRRKA
jgi:hypothetical protein